MTRTIQVVVFFIFFNYGLSAQEKFPITPTKVQIDTKQLRKPQATSHDATSSNMPSLTAFESFSNVAVQPGPTSQLTSSTDWTGADHVSVAISCPASTSLQNTVIVIGWAIPLPNAPNYTATDAIIGKNLLLPNMGGAVVPSYGNMLQLLVINSGSTSIACDQLTVYGVVH